MKCPCQKHFAQLMEISYINVCTDGTSNLHVKKGILSPVSPHDKPAALYLQAYVVEWNLLHFSTVTWRNVWSKSTSFADSVTPYRAAISTKWPAKIRNDAVPDGIVSLEAIPSSLFIFVCSNKLVDMKKIVQRQELHLLSKVTYLRLPLLIEYKPSRA